MQTFKLVLCLAISVTVKCVYSFSCSTGCSDIFLEPSECLLRWTGRLKQATIMNLMKHWPEQKCWLWENLLLLFHNHQKVASCLKPEIEYLRMHKHTHVIWTKNGWLIQMLFSHTSQIYTQTKNKLGLPQW